MAIKTLRVFAEYTSTGFVPMPTAGGIDYGYTLASTFPSTTPSTFQTDDPDIDVTVTAMTDFYVWIRINGTAWNPSYTRNVRVYPDSPDINSVVMNMIIATGPAGVSSYTQIVQTANRLYFNGATTDSVYNSKFAGKTYINELNFGTAPQLATVATSGAYADLSGKPALSTVATSGLYADLSSKPSGTAPLSYNSGTNSFVISQATTSTNGYLSSTDWNTFNNKFTTPTGDTTQYVDGTGGLQTFPVLASADKLVMVVRNTSGATITKGTVVYINGASGNKPTIGKALANSDATSAQTLGLVQADISNNSNGNVVLVGSIIDINTSSFTEGQQLYLSGTTAGAFTSTKILAPTHLVYVGIVTRAHPTQGVIEVKIQNGYELDELHDVQISSPADKDILYRDAATSLWKHAGITSVLGYTPYNGTSATIRGLFSATSPLSYNSTTGAFTISQANGSTNGFLSSTDWTTFNSKQNALTLGNVSEVSSNVLMFPDGGTGKTIGNLTIQVVQASASTNGYLSSTDWTTFNNKQGTVTLTTTGTSGASTFSAGTLNIPQYQGAITLTTTGTSGAATFSANTLNIPQYQTALTNPVTGTGTSGNFAVWSSSSAIGGSNLTQSSGSIFSSGGLIFNSYNSAFDTIGSITRHSVVGLVLKAATASAFDFSLYSAGGTVLISNPSGTNNINFNSGQVWFNGGNVGIGTSTTTSKLTISETNAQTNQIDFVGNNSTAKGHIGQFSNNLYISSNYFFGGGAQQADTSSLGQAAIVLSGGATTSSFIDFNTSNAGATSPGNKMRITSAGNVGIGISDPLNVTTNRTSVTINGTSTSILSFGSGGVGKGYIYNDGTNLEIYSAGNTVFAAGGPPRMRLTSSGNLGIGASTNPTYLLEVSTGGGSQRIRVGTLQNNNNSATFEAITTANNTTASAAFFRANAGGSATIGVTTYNKTFGDSGDFANLSNQANTVAIQITPGANILLATETDNGERLYVNGSIRATGNITANSDLTLKKNLQLIENPIDKLMSLNGYLYQWKENDEYQYGVIAQEVEKVMSYAVSTGKTGIKGVSYNQLTPLLIEGFKLHNSEITQLKERVKYLEAKLA